MNNLRIDVHHHILPPHYVETLGADFLGAQGSSGRLPVWSINGAIELMDEAGITTAITSISAPGFASINEKSAAALARRCNDFSATMVADFPSRFGMFAGLPMHSVDAAVAEVVHAYDVLKTDGVCLLSNYGGHYLGDKSFHPLYEELNKRAAVVFVHPTSPQHRVDLAGLSPSMLEFPFDTTRTIASLIFEGVTTRFPDIRWIFSHAGGTLPYLAGRFEMLTKNNDALRARIPNGFSRAVQPLFFDLALSSNAVHLKALREFLPDTQLLFGTDYPFGPAGQMMSGVAGLQAVGLGEATLEAINSGNALKLFPRLNQTLFQAEEL